MSDTLQTLALLLYDLGCVLDRKRSPDGQGFRLKLHEKHPDAPLSPIYLNLRTPENPKPGPLTAGVVVLIGRLLWNLVLDKRAGDHAHRVAGVPRAGDPLADAVSLYSELPVLRLSKAEDAGTRKITTVVEGDVIEGQEVLIVDDLITQADSKLEAIEALRSRGLHPRAVYVVVDREQGGVAELERRDIPCFALFTLTDLLDRYVRSGRLTAAERADVLTYLQQSTGS